MLSWLFRRFRGDKAIENCYVQAGREFGDAVSYIYMGESLGFEDLLREWEIWEAEYARRGYRTFPVEDFVALGGYGQALKDLGAKRAAGEAPVFHASIYRERFLGKIDPAIDLRKMMNPPEERADSDDPPMQEGTYVIPSTK